ncbi:MAG: hypothetical protein AAFR17_12635, partial [Pseudomonadota bacterium]
MDGHFELPLETCRIEPVWTIWVELAARDDARVREALTEALGLRYGAYSGVAFETAEGVQFFRPEQGSVAEGHGATVEMPARVLTFSIPRAPELLALAIETIRHFHSYEEPV